MYNLGDIFYDDNEYSARAQFCNEHGYMIKEIEPDENGRRFQISEVEINQEDIAMNEIVELKEWFDIFYAQHEQKYRRLYTLNKQTDEGEDPHDKLLALYAEAEIKRARIQEIERLLEE